jgi:hypothetical protein
MSIQKRRAFFGCDMNTFAGSVLSRFAVLWQKLSKRGGWLGSYGRFRTWREAYPSTSMAPTSCGWVLGGSCSGLVVLSRKRELAAGRLDPVGESVNLTRTSAEPTTVALITIKGIMKRKSRGAKKQKVSPFDGELKLTNRIVRQSMWAVAVIG